MFDDLYQELILDHSQHSHNRGSLGNDVPNVFVNNPVCGDELHLWVDFSNGRVSEAKFSGRGCMISQASASMMTDLLKGADIVRLKQLIDDFQSALNGSGGEEDKKRLGDLVALEGVKDYPVRMRCALLAFEALRQIIQKAEAASPTQADTLKISVNCC
ncbi:MAG: SUF system NifU family Fe-S cluster assembly protein [Deltaproteobacteria bacterium]|nr:SUF system NifU family Fe-S cluster assembly protein [Deltaproteobacteria bacterium]